MADTITNTTLMQTKRRLVVKCEYVSDGTGSTDAIVVDKSTFTGPNGLEPTKLVVEKIEYQVDGVQLVLEFDHTTDDPLATLVGQGLFDFAQNGKYQGLVDPASAGTTGDIVLTSVGHTTGDKGTVVLYMRKKD